jgi:hypothetical protein
LSQKTKDFGRSSMKKYTLNRLRGVLSNGKDIYLYSEESENGIFYVKRVSIWRPDVVKSVKEKNTKETYVVTVEKWDKRYSPEGQELIDESAEFSSLQEVIEYLDKKGYLKKSDWIEDEKE